jgi:hypothetical protein
LCEFSQWNSAEINTSDNLTYLWSNGGTTSSKSNLTSGVYTVTIKDATNCSVEQSIFFDEPQPIKINGVNIVPINNGNPGILLWWRTQETISSPTLWIQVLIKPVMFLLQQWPVIMPFMLRMNLAV